MRVLALLCFCLVGLFGAVQSGPPSSQAEEVESATESRCRSQGGPASHCDGYCDDDTGLLNLIVLTQTSSLHPHKTKRTATTPGLYTMRVLALLCFCLTVLFGAVHSVSECTVETPHDLTRPCLDHQESIIDSQTGITYCCSEGLLISAAVAYVNGERIMRCSCYTLEEHCARYPFSKHCL
ncbi:hypothetical protein PoB_005367100 [Plakobranchus ocellatus]|uniref:Uncharacterized protein n=1 Tax=Plakobranchus ocellatus TaxID=259542 RepID=A0AAV4C748_9GAST|nr:hypothetical protein PoB_005367100 [Plakobranchus ocellatus]